MEAIQMFSDRLDQLLYEVERLQMNYDLTYTVSHGAYDMTGHHTQGCPQVSQGIPVEEDFHAFYSMPSGNPYTSPYNSNWRDSTMIPMSNTNYPSQYFECQIQPSSSTPPNIECSFLFPTQTTPMASPESRIEELLEQFIADQQRRDAESRMENMIEQFLASQQMNEMAQQRREVDDEQRFQHLTSMFDHLQAHSSMLEAQISQLNASHSQTDCGQLLIQLEANSREGAMAISPLEEREPQKEARKEHPVNQRKHEVSSGKPVKDYILFPNPGWFDFVDRFMELIGERSSKENQKNNISCEDALLEEGTSFSAKMQAEQYPEGFLTDDFKVIYWRDTG